MDTHVKIQKLHDDSVIPTRQTPGSAGYDLYSYCPEGLLLPPGVPVLIPTGICMEIPQGYDIEIRPRSGLSTKNLLFIPNSPGTIDSDYRGEIQVCMVNFSGKDFRIEHRMRIAQLLLRKNYEISFSVVDSLSTTDRGAGGFGSTGV